MAAVVGAALLVSGLLSAPSVAQAAPAAPTVPDHGSLSDLATGKYPAGTYIVQLEKAPAASYSGGISGYAGTKVGKGKQLNAKASAVAKYTDLLASDQDALTNAVGVTPLYNYTLAFNGFAAKLSSKEAARLARSSAVKSIVPDEILHTQAESSLDFLDVSTAGGVWDSIGGHDEAGKGIVVGDLDTGIAPENPSFAGDALGTSATTGAPYLDGSTVTFAKADGSTFASTEIPDSEQWTSADYSTKIIAAKYYVDGFGAGKIGTPAAGEYLSPRDGAGHGSHTASTAAGNYGVATTVEGQDFGSISGVAPAAKLAIYKVCWSGPKPEVETDDGCATADMVAAIDQSVADGVDVLNFSIGGGSAETTFSPTDEAFLGASAAGIFVATAAGNSGPGASTLDNAAPWETTVAASTIPDYEGTVQLGNDSEYVGATISVDRESGDDPLTGPLVDATAYAAADTAAGATAATLCGPKSLTTVPTGSIVLCDRGTYDRTAKSAEVARAGGAGMVLVNVPGAADDIDNDFHSVPSIHLHSAVHDALHAYAAEPGATAALYPTNITPDVTPVPQVAGFSSHGPVLAAGSDVLKPDIAAPGVSILAAVANAAGADPQWAFYSGTSMATPHITGLAALYLGEKPTATPAEIKSAMMTTATDLVDDAGNDVTDPFTQGAGEVHPLDYLDPGIYYPAALTDWQAYLEGVDEATFAGVDPIDPSDLNQASIAVGDLIGEQTVTRSVTSLSAGSYTASVSGLEGVTSSVSPSTLDFTAAGQTKSFTVTFTNATAPDDEWATGFLTWTSSDHIARSPLAIHPTSAIVPAVVTGTGTTGSTAVTVTPGSTGALPVAVDGLTKGEVAPNDSDPSLPYTGIALVTDDPDQNYASAVHYVPAGTKSVEFDTYPTTDEDQTDLDLYVASLDPDTGEVVALVGQSATASAGETVTLDDPEPGYYLTETDFFASPADGVPYIDVAYDLNPATNTGDLAADPAPLEGVVGTDSSVDVLWNGLDTDSLYNGFVNFGDQGTVSTEVYVSTAETVVPTTTLAPSISGTPTIGATVTGDPGTWNLSSKQLAFSYRWTADGEPIPHATGKTLIIPNSALGESLAFVVTATLAGQDAVSVPSAAVVVTGADNASALTNLIAPAISGSAQADKTVVANTGKWNVASSNLQFSYQWNLDGTPVEGATSSVYSLSASEIGRSLSATVIARVVGTDKPVSATSAPVPISANDGTATVVNVKKPSISGSLLLTKTVTAHAGTWNFPSSDLSFTYQWTSDGKNITGADESTLRLGNSLLGHKLAVVVTANLAKETVPATSAAAGVVRAGSTTTITLSDSTITTRVKEKVTVKVKADGSGKETGTVIVHYGSKTKKDVMHTADRGTITVTLPKLKKGGYKVWAEYTGNSLVVGDSSVKKNLKVRTA